MKLKREIFQAENITSVLFYFKQIWITKFQRKAQLEQKMKRFFRFEIIFKYGNSFLLYF